MRNFYQYPFMGYPMYPDYGYPEPQMPQQSFEQSYIENILRLNKGKIATVYMNFENSQWGSKSFTRYILLTIYLNYITFDEEINYYYPYDRP